MPVVRVGREQEPEQAAAVATSTDRSSTAPPAAASSEAPATATRGTRGRRQSKLLRIRTDLERRWVLLLSVGGVAVVLAAWAVAASRMEGSSILPTPAATWAALVKLSTDGVLLSNLWASLQRILIGYAISVAIGVVVGLAIGTYASVEAFF